MEYIYQVLDSTPKLSRKPKIVFFASSLEIAVDFIRGKYNSIGSSAWKEKNEFKITYNTETAESFIGSCYFQAIFNSECFYDIYKLPIDVELK
jgi:hypothetical protein